MSKILRAVYIVAGLGPGEKLKRGPDFLCDLCLPITPVRWVDIDVCAGGGIGPTQRRTAATHHQPMDFTVLDHRQFKIIIEGGGRY